MVITVPRQTGRFFVLELLDAYTNNFFNIGMRNTPAEGGRFALIGPGHDAAQAPPGCTPIACPNGLVWLLGRVLVDDEADLPAARAFQSGFAIDAPPAGAPPASVAQWQEGGDPAVGFIANLARALADFPPPPSQRGVFALLESVHLRLPADGRIKDLRPATLEGLRQGHAAAMAMIEGYTRSPSKAAWRYSTRLGRYGDDLMLRAATAFEGLGALSGDIAIYATADYDSDGQPLDGRHVYRIRFEDGGDLPADASLLEWNRPQKLFCLHARHLDHVFSDVKNPVVDHQLDHLFRRRAGGTRRIPSDPLEGTQVAFVSERKRVSRVHVAQPDLLLVGGHE